MTLPSLSPLTGGIMGDAHLNEAIPTWQSLSDEWRTNPDRLAHMADGLLALLGRLQTIESQWLTMLLGQLPASMQVSPFLAHVAAALTKTMPTPLSQSFVRGGQSVAFNPSFANALCVPQSRDGFPLPLTSAQPVDEIGSAPSIAPPSSDLQHLIIQTAQRYGVDPALALAVAKAESNFNPFARSPKGAMGVMQLMPETAKSLGVTDPFNPAQNIDGGIRYLRHLLEHFNAQVTLAVAAYNAGPNAVARYGGVPPYPETQTFLRRVLSYWQAFREQLAQWTRERVGYGQSSRWIGWQIVNRATIDEGGNLEDGQVDNLTGRQTGKQVDGHALSPFRSSPPTHPDSEVTERTTKPTRERPFKDVLNGASSSKANSASSVPSLLSSQPASDALFAFPSASHPLPSSSVPRPLAHSEPSSAPVPSSIHRLAAEVPTADGEKSVRVLIQLEKSAAEGRGQAMSTVSILVQVPDSELTAPIQTAMPHLRQQLWEQGIALAQFAVFAEDNQRQRRDPADFTAPWRRLPSVAPSRHISAEEEGVWA
ncbi:MAG: hypothetical protein SLRJCFUN_000639 [Candidatus Fervidibacter sp.]